ncbi:component of the polarisome [Elasticomyces elasticus]|nr:component of the polarisome [Elasticomyces elasticus]
MNRPGPGPLSPLSSNSADSFATRYGNSLGGTPNDVPYGNSGPYASARPRQVSPPGLQHPSSSTDMSRPSVSSSSLGRPPSSASSVARSSDGRMGFGHRPESGRSTFRPDNEDALQRHYHILKGYLASSLRDEKGNMKPNKARDKLLRLSVTQFMELSTDVYDELLRREDERTGRVQNVPKSLPPMQNFHPKRNQARQKLSTLPVERFRQLATDVFYELERRIPRFAGGDIDRPISSSSNNRGPTHNGMRPPPGMRGPPLTGPPGRPPMGPNGMAPPNAPYQTFRPQSPGPGGPPPITRPPTAGSESSSYGRPLPKTFQSNTIIPNKSTMIEDDDNEDEDEQGAFLLDKSPSSVGFPASQGASVSSTEDKERIGAQQAEIAELREKIDDLEGRVLEKEQELEGLHGTLFDKDHELEKVKTTGQSREADLNAERNGWFDLREELEQKHHDVKKLHEEDRNEWQGLRQEVEQKHLDAQRLHKEDRDGWDDLRQDLEQKHLDAQSLHEQLQRELDQLRQGKDQDVEALRANHDRELGELQSQLSTSHRQTIGDLRSQLDNVHDQTSGLQQLLQTHQAENEELRKQLQSAHERKKSVDTSGYERRIELLQDELALQEKLTNEVRDEAMLYLREMRDLSAQNDYAIEQEEKLATRVAQLERANEDWRHRYAKVKAQNKSLRASTMGLGLQTSFDSGSLIRREGVLSDGGLVQDVDVTRFQMAIDDLLKAARLPEAEPMRESVKNVAVCVQAITSAVGTDGYPTPSPSPLGHGSDPPRHPESVSKLQARVMGTAKSLITATKQHSTSFGLSPVVLLDAAASNLTASVVALIKAVGIRPSPKSELLSDIGDEDTLAVVKDLDASAHDSVSSFYDDRLSPERERSISPMEVRVHSPEALETPPKPAPLNIGRSNTTKKGWFGGWGKKESVDETGAVVNDEQPIPQVNGVVSEAHGTVSPEEYDPYNTK